MSLDTLDRLARSYPGGIAALAARLDKHPGTLRAELKPPVGSTAKLGWLDAITIMECARQVALPGALTPLDVVEADFGRVAVDLSMADGLADAALMQRVQQVVREFGDVLTEVSNDVADGVVSDRELARVRQETGELISALQGLLSHLAAMNQAGKPVHLREAA